MIAVENGVHGFSGSAQDHRRIKAIMGRPDKPGDDG
jgi:hypothetical protein